MLVLEAEGAMGRDPGQREREEARSERLLMAASSVGARKLRFCSALRLGPRNRYEVQVPIVWS